MSEAFYRMKMTYLGFSYEHSILTASKKAVRTTK